MAEFWQGYVFPTALIVAYILAIVLVSDGYAQEPRYVRRPFTREPGWNEESVNFKLKEFLDQSQVPLR